MGKEIEKIALERNHQIIAKIDNDTDWNSSNLSNCDVALEFSIPKTVVTNIKKCFEGNVPVVVGTTGWYDHLESIKQFCISQKKSMLFASNFSIGVNIFFEINKKLAELMNAYPQYKAEINEIHHTQKIDAPSGTAITIANQIIERIDKLNSWNLEKAEIKDQLSIKAERIGQVPGTHSVIYDSDIDSILIKHEAKSRKGFALGAVLAGEFLIGKTGFYTMNDLLKV
jgi:4-hydroxy-tetrahydrodipicolinate reductase